MTSRLLGTFICSLTLLSSGCSGESDSSGGNAGSGGAAAGSGGSGGAAAAGGAGATSGGGKAGASATGGTGGVIDVCESPNAGLDPSSFPECPTCIGEPAHCVPTSVVDSTVPGQSDRLAPCDPSSVCVPDVLISTLGNYVAPTCTSIGGSAGRCLSTCIEAVGELGSFLPRDTCAEGEKCAPCGDPRTGEPSGACELPCDDGPVEPSIVFDRCCGDESGICVPPDILEPTQAAALGGDTCSGDNLCAPAVFAEGGFTPKTCTSVAGAEGRCLSTCVALVAKESAFLPRDVCEEGELCAPCTDPRSGELTAACAINGDAPTEDPVVFDTACCSGTGLCVPSDAVPDRYASVLPVDDCGSEGAGWVCAPELKLADIDAPLPSCTPSNPGSGDAGGACVPQCIADKQIADGTLQASDLQQQDCEAGWVCAPCEYPSDGTRTGACD